MEFGVALPEEFRADTVALRDFVQAVDGAGFRFIDFVDHVVGPPPVVRTDAAGRPRGGYTNESLLHEPLILSSYILALTRQITCITAVLILPQRQTVLVARQVAELAVLSGERFELGVGVGYRPAEYEALGVPYEQRGARYEEQIEVMRLLWAQPLVTFEGKFHTLHNVGFNPRPPSGRVRLWMGGGGAADPAGVRASRRVLHRIGRMADGWNIIASSFEDYVARRDIMREAARAAGRDPSEIAISHGLTIDGRDMDQQVAHARRWEAAGITHAPLRVSPQVAHSPDARLRKLLEFRAAFDSQRSL